MDLRRQPTNVWIKSYGSSEHKILKINELTEREYA